MSPWASGPGAEPEEHHRDPGLVTGLPEQREALLVGPLRAFVLACERARAAEDPVAATAERGRRAVGAVEQGLEPSNAFERAVQDPELFKRDRDE